MIVPSPPSGDRTDIASAEGPRRAVSRAGMSAQSGTRRGATGNAGTLRHMGEHPTLQSIPGGRDEGHRRPRPQPIREPLWREVLGLRLRQLRQEQRRTLAETAGRAGVSPQYLSEVERGRKEPSSEMIAALAGALGTSLGELTGQVSEVLRRERLTSTRPAVAPSRIPRTGAQAVLLAA